MPKYGPSGHVVEDEGSALAQRPIINFTGSGVAATDAGGKTVVTVSSSSGPSLGLAVALDARNVTF